MPTRTPPIRWLPIMIGIALSSTLGDCWTTSSRAPAAPAASGSVIGWPNSSTSTVPSWISLPFSSNTST